MTKLSVIIVVYTEYELMSRCIESVTPQLPADSEIIVVHNKSGRVGIEIILKKHPGVVYIKNKENLGFGQAVNVGVAQAKGKYILVLTPDTMLFPKTVPLTLTYIKRHPQAGLVSCRVYSPLKQLNRSCFTAFPDLWSHLLELNMPLYKLINYFKPGYIPYLYSEKDHQHILYPKHMVGAYMLLSKQALMSVGAFAKDYFLYREETDLCKRLGEKGWKIVYLPVGGVIHTADGAVHESITQTSPHYLRSMYIFLKKHYGVGYALLAWLLGTISCLLSVPFLFLVSSYKNMIGQPSQATFLYQCWLKITSWHLNHGLKNLLISLR